jgi:hypothetical protein|tara:strand:+ start:10842 stop:11318 length:477 start_codon:yes stop_codon:yes gene_type:complete
MNFNFRNILPKSANNNFQGHKVALWGFVLFTILMTWRSIVHMLFEQYGFHEIGSFVVISGDPDPMLLIYRFFSLWGFAQLIFCLVCWVVIYQYRALIPLMYLIWLFEWSFRTFGYPLIRDEIAVQGLYTNGITPGASFAPYATILLIILFGLSLLQKK